MNVYEPHDDSLLIASFVHKISEGKDVLDMGTGTGILALHAALAGANKVVAADINYEAVKTAMNNARRMNLDIEFRVSDLFDDVPEAFDIILFNPPYLPEGEDKHYLNEWETQAIIGGRTGREVLFEFLKHAKFHLKIRGYILVLISSITNIKKVEGFCKNNNYEIEILGTKKIPWEMLYCLKITPKKYLGFQ